MTEQSDTIIEELTSINKSVKEIEIKGKYQSLIERNDFFFFFNIISSIAILLIAMFSVSTNDIR
ncbi:hypothetical protein [Acinetobacter baumannii]|uniref:hypothetical protein n=1 Tax=Acinetobacter baumannii TaxID=470 RepID=UPI0038926545